MHEFTKNRSIEGRKYFEKKNMNLYIILMKIRYSNHAKRKVPQI